MSGGGRSFHGGLLAGVTGRPGQPKMSVTALAVPADLRFLALPGEPAVSGHVIAIHGQPGIGGLAGPAGAAVLTCAAYPAGPAARAAGPAAHGAQTGPKTSSPRS